MRVLRRIFAMRAAHAGWPGPGVPRSASLATWWTATVVPCSHSSHRRLRSRRISSLRGVRTGTGAGSVMTARRSCRRMIPPNRATRSGLPSRRSLASKQVLGPSLVMTFALWRAAILVTVDWCLAARVFSIDVSGVPAQGVQPPDVLGEQVVVDDAPVLGSVDPHDVVVVQVLEPGPVPRFAVVPVAGALGRDHVRRHPQRDLPVDRPAAPGEFRVAVLDGDVVAEEPRRLGAGVGDQGLIRVEFQPEGLPEERRQLGLDLLGFGLRPDESQYVIICVPSVAQAPVTRGPSGHPRGARAAAVASSRAAARSPRCRARASRRCILLYSGFLARRSPRVYCGISSLLDELVELVQVDVTEDGETTAALCAVLDYAQCRPAWLVDAQTAGEHCA